MKPDNSILMEVNALRESNGEGVLVIVVGTDGHTPQVPGAKMLVFKDGSIVGTVGGGQIEKRAIDRALELIKEPGAAPRVETWHLLHDLGMCCGGQMSLYLEPIVPSPRLILFGAGHVALPTARLAAEVGFRVTVIDPREDWNNSLRFPTAENRFVVPFEDHLSDFSPLPTDYILIVTQGHEHDEYILSQMVHFPVQYLGMIGSQRKVKRTLRKLPPTSDWSSELHAPVGLDIDAETPNEIAVAIVGEMIHIRRSAGENQTSGRHASQSVQQPDGG